MKKRFLSTILTLALAFSLVAGSNNFVVHATTESATETIYGAEETVKVVAGESERENNFNDGWKFYLGDSTSAQNKGFDDSSWTSVTLPHDFSITQSFTSSGEAESGFLPGGTGWYRKTFTLPEGDVGKNVVLSFDGVYSDAYVYVNGTYVGEHHYGYTNFAFDITDYITIDGQTENVIAVKAVNNIPTSRWYSGSGIYRDVTLIVTNPVHVDYDGTYVTTPNIENGDGTVNVAVEVVNGGDSDASVTVTNTVYKKNGTTALAEASATTTVASGEEATVSANPVVSSPALWSLENPNLYVVRTTVTVDGTVVDCYDSEFGFRYFSFDSEGFHLNGKNVKLNGVCMHHDQGALGSAAYYDAMYRQLSKLKDMGCNAIRTAHNPADEDFINICNELGLLVIEEVFDGLVDYKNENTNDFSKYFETELGSDNGLYNGESSMTYAEYVTSSVVKRDKNDPSIIAWSFGNEIQEGTYWTNVSRYDDICADFIEWVNGIDGTRPITSGDNNRGGNSDLVNVINTITNSGGVAGFNYANTASELYNLAQSYGGTTGAIIASETSSATNSRGIYVSQASNSSADGKYHLTSYDTSSVSWGITAHDSIYNTYQYDCVAGEFVWTGFDYIGEPTPWNGTTSGDSGRGAIPNSSYFGIIETTGFEKDTYYLYRSQWNKEDTTLHLVTAWDSDNYMLSSSKTPVWVYSNAPVVKLYRDGTLIGTATRVEHTSSAGHTYYTYTTESNSSSICTTSSGSGADGLYAVFNVAYTAGTLSAKAFEADGTTEISLSGNSGKNTVTTPGTVSKLVISQNKTEIAADGSSLAYIEVDVTDASGNLDTTATNNIQFTLSGNGKIVGVDNGDQATTAKFQQASVLTSATSANINAYAGKALVIVRSTEDAGKITVDVTSSGLTGGTAEITTLAVGDETSESTALSSYTMVRDYTVMTGTAPTLKTDATGTLANGTTVSGIITWDTISEDIYAQAGDNIITGTATFEGVDQVVAVTARLHVIADVVALRNISTATMQNTVPTLPTNVLGVMADGTLSGEFAVTWDTMSADDFDTVGEIVIVNGTATVFDDDTLPVTASIRVAEAVNTESSNVAPMADSLTQDISSSYQSDVLSSITNGTIKPGDNTSERWTNWNNRMNSADATLTFTWATAQMLSGVNLYYYYDNCCAYPEAIEFSYSLDGQNYTVIEVTAEQVETYSLGAQYSYTFEEPINPVGLKIKFTQQNGTTGNNCVGLTEAEIMTYAGSIEVNTSANLSGITVDGTALSGFAADSLLYEVEGTEIAATTDVNAGITVLPAYNGVVRILTVSEDGNAVKTYEITVTESVVCTHENTEVRNVAEATCTAAGYTGDTYCLDCEEQLATGEEIAQLAHETTIINEKDATCSEEGYTGDTFCTSCNSTIESGEAIAKLAHTVELQNAVVATCTAEGYTGDKYCTVCETIVEQGTTISKTKHDYESSTTDGVTTYTCSDCGDSYTEMVLSAPDVSVSAAAVTSTKKIKFTGTFEDYENINKYYEVTEHGIVYITKTRLGSRNLTVNTAGRTKVAFSSYKEDGSFAYTMKPKATGTYYAARAYLKYVDDNGISRYVYSDQIVVRYSSLAN